MTSKALVIPAILVSAATLWAATLYLTPSRVEVAEPAYPYQALYGGDVFLEFAVADDGTPRDVHVRHPAPPFTEPATRALAQWKLQLPPPEANEASESLDRRVALVWQFRMAQALAQTPPERTYEATLFGTGRDRPPVPTTIFEAAQPIQAVNEGTAVLAVTVDEKGNVKVVRALNRAGALTDAATAAVRRWKFSPALVDGEPATGELLIAVTFPRPVLGAPPPRPPQ